MTRLSFSPFSAFSRTPARSTGLLRGLRRTSPHLPPLAALPADAPIVRGRLRLTLHDGAPRLYLLDHRDFAATTSPDVAYDARVQTAYVFALQGHRPDCLAQHLGLPLAAAEAIAEHAARAGATATA
ncbi:hypothetical protein PUR71_12425 [Streptomyces sp. SP17BM10]|uniref:hypothetical protein n=1 Tax=Streptomyces sp. SP17BM10 TaxID=3002530 RepID=UPI002E79109E|nr:hypothetical protein [Streptomyces sp. SP17BM10]MEE1783706.1 hypothetical protein [Streptomyces sp. SP17BM10]